MRATSYLDNYYARLGISRTASLDEINQAYRSAARRFHPDANKQTGAHELFLLIQEAFDTLSDREKRWAYDSTLPSDIDTPPSIMVNDDVYQYVSAPKVREILDRYSHRDGGNA